MRQSSGFTLIELLVVIAIIALLITLLLPSLQRAEFLANQVACLSRLRVLMMAVVTYSEDNDGAFPLSDPHNQLAYGSWIPVLARSMGSPMAPGEGLWGENSLRRDDRWFCPIPAKAERNSELQQQSPGWRYSINYILTNVKYGTGERGRPARFEEVAFTSRCGVMMEGGWRPGPIHHPDLSYGAFFGRNPPLMGPVHYGLSMNICYADSHGQTVGWLGSNRDQQGLLYNPGYPWTHALFWGVPGRAADVAEAYTGLQ